MHSWFTRKRFFIALGLGLVVLVLVAFFFIRSHKQEFALNSLNFLSKVSKLFPLQPDTKAEIDAINQISQVLLQKDGVLRTYLILLQNNYELRPGGGFLGQYAIVKIKDGAVVSTFVEDANLLDQRIVAKITPPYPLTRKLGLKRWKFRDSNFSPDFPTNVDKTEYFYRLAGGYQKFNGVVAVNAFVFDHLLDITGPIQLPGYGDTFSSADGSLKLEERVERAYLADDISAEAKQARKNIMKNLATVMAGKLATVENIPKVFGLGLEELREKNVMLNFTDENLQTIVKNVKWDGSVDTTWDGDYLMLVDANMGALKTDYYVKRSLDYTVDFTGEKPMAHLIYTYANTATHGDWRTSDYHTYLRVYVPSGSTLVNRKLVSYPLTDEAFNKTFFGVFVDTLINGQTPGEITYELPATITPDNYKLMIQKQSGVGTIPVKITVKTKDGEETQTADLKKDLVFTFQQVEEKK